MSNTPDRVKRFFQQRQRAEEGTWSMPQSMEPGTPSRGSDLRPQLVEKTAPSIPEVVEVLGPVQWSGQFAPLARTLSPATRASLRNLLRAGAVLFAVVGFFLLPSAVPAGILFLSISIFLVSAAIYLAGSENRTFDDTIVVIEGYETISKADNW